MFHRGRGSREVGVEDQWTSKCKDCRGMGTWKEADKEEGKSANCADPGLETSVHFREFSVFALV